MNQPHKWAKEIKAWADGAIIERFPSVIFPGAMFTWFPVDSPDWNSEHYSYRIKPKPKVKKWKWVYFDPIENTYKITAQKFSDQEEINSQYLVRPAGHYRLVQKIDETLVEVDG